MRSKAIQDKSAVLGRELTRILLRMGWKPPERSRYVDPKEPVLEDDRLKHRIVVEVTLSAPGSEREARNLLNLLLKDCNCIGKGTMRHTVVKLACKGFQRVMHGMGYKRW